MTREYVEGLKSLTLVKSSPVHDLIGISVLTKVETSITAHWRAFVSLHNAAAVGTIANFTKRPLSTICAASDVQTTAHRPAAASSDKR